MADRSSIVWTDATWNPVAGCSLVSPGCTNCYAMRMAARIERMGGAPHYGGTTKRVNGHPVWTGAVNLAPAPILTAPLRWRRPRRIFVNSMSDLFHDAVPDEWIDRVFAVMALSPRHTFQVLTKRPERMRQYMLSIGKSGLHGRQMEMRTAVREVSPVKASIAEAEAVARVSGARETGTWRPLLNVWLGVSVEDQRRADERIPLLLDTPAAVRWCSAEPLLGPLDLTRIVLIPSDHPERGKPDVSINAQTGWLGSSAADMARLDWVVAGSESGPGARPMHPGWARSLRDQCAAAGVPFVFKQWGEWISVLDRDRDDPDWRADYPKHERIGDRVLNLAGGCGFHGEQVQIMRRVGNKAAGRVLDGVIHDAYPGGARGDVAMSETFAALALTETEPGAPNHG